MPSPFWKSQYMKLRGVGSWFRLKPNTQKVWLTRVGRQTLVWASLYSFALSLLPFAYAESKTPAIIIPYDTITSPGIEVWPQAKVITRRLFGIEGPVPGERIEFFEGNRYLGLALTGGDGIGVIRYTPYSEGLKRIKVRFPATSAYGAEDGEILVGVWNRARPLLFVSIEALRERTKEVIFPFIGRVRRDVERRPMEQAIDTLSGLSKGISIIYIYEGNSSNVPEIKSWLSRNKFPVSPLIVQRDNMRFLNRLISERKRDIKGAVLTPDNEAEIFRKEGIKTLLIVEKKKRSEYKGEKDTTIVTDWREIEKKID